MNRRPSILTTLTTVSARTHTAMATFSESPLRRFFVAGDFLALIMLAAFPPGFSRQHASRFLHQQGNGVKSKQLTNESA